MACTFSYIQDNTNIFVNNIQQMTSLVDKYISAIDQQVSGDSFRVSTRTHI